ncbi:uncharacterized protein BKA55DRAFT_684072 [Fusarium redolens]|uniref:Uncharacterized protein n=1 Tax=Fusarium redolens TaxID=48865 RepID=A0A9P9KQS2_FUSRE|nr:uncharacterized protein BKA55DRAFT_684072 [Fusarium redolens]KAH7266792.1 hypothetical protein BKA55DRAFT_684072 [Fusarium redolens]
MPGAKRRRPPPPPPPLPPLPPTPAKTTPTGSEPKESLDKDEPAPEDCVLYAHLNSKPPDPCPYHYKSVYYFFYDDLGIPDVLQVVLEASDSPKLREAKVFGYSVAPRGRYTSLIEGEPGAEVLGQAFQAQSAEEEYKLGWYHTSAYIIAPCLIQFTDGGEPRKVAGLAFMDAGDQRAWRTMRFDYRAWKSQMGTRLPRNWQRSAVEPSS